MNLLCVEMVIRPVSTAQSVLMKKEGIAPVTVNLISLVLINLLDSTVSIKLPATVLPIKQLSLRPTFMPFVSMMEFARVLLLLPMEDDLDVIAQMHGLGEYDTELALSIF